MSTVDVQLSFSRARSIVGGATGSLPYQTATSSTVFAPIGSNTTILQSNGTTATWVAVSGITAGNATNATNATYMTSFDNRVISPSEDTANRMRFGFTSWANNNTSPYADYLHMRGYTDASGGNENLVMFRKDVIGMRIWQQAFGSATAYSSFKDVALELNTATHTGLTVGAAWQGGVTGEIRATNEITAYYTSDARLKENVVLIADPIEKVMKIRGVNFDWVDEHIAERGGEDGYFVRKHDVGVIAQEIEEILPEAVATRDNGYKAVKYEKIVPLLIEVVKEQQKQINQILQTLKDMASK